MLKNKSKSWPNVPFNTWEHEKQTEMKHKVFSYYLPIWLKILGRWNRNLNYVDGFGGIGAYHNIQDIKEGKYISNNYGSPILSISAIRDLQNKKGINRANVVIVDKEKENIENLKKILAYEKIDNKEIVYDDRNFGEVISEILKIKNIAPTFFLLDPFGYSGIKLSILKQIMELPKAEILLNFMYNSLQRWIENPDPSINKIYDEYFGGDEWRKAKGKHLAEKENELVSIFRNKCKNFCKFVYPFKLKFPYRDQTYYYLIHLTNHRLGCSLMKDSFAKFNGGKDEYSGEKYQSSLFDDIEQKEKREKFSQRLIAKYSSKSVAYFKIIEDFIDETDLLEREIKNLLSKMEKDSKISVVAHNKRKRRGGFEDGDIITFV